ncbi:MAG: CvpA family protein [Acetobacter peroxydans]|jgi:membrane protein required for colicin V production|nr:CvpA family protein [Acetobacter peroxydans]MCI2079278.1 CvpA family protein [Acetobacter peroxydans]
MAAIDGIALALITLSVLHGLWRGLTRAALGIVVWTLAGLAALRFNPPLTHWAQTYITSPTGARAAAFLGVLLVAALAGGLLSARIVQVVRATPLDGPDRLLGGVFGLARGALIVVLGYMLAHWVLQPQDMQALEKGSRLTPYIQAAARGLQTYMADFSAKGVAPSPSTGHDANL